MTAAQRVSQSDTVFTHSVLLVTDFMKGDTVRLKGSQTYCSYCGWHGCKSSGSQHTKVNVSDVGEVTGKVLKF